MKNEENIRTEEISAKDPFDWIMIADRWMELDKPDEVRRCLHQAESISKDCQGWIGCGYVWKRLLQDHESAIRCYSHAEKTALTFNDFFDLVKINTRSEAGEMFLRILENLAKNPINEWRKIAISWVEDFGNTAESMRCLRITEEIGKGNLILLMYCAEVWKQHHNADGEVVRCMKEAEKHGQKLTDWLGFSFYWKKFGNAEESMRCMKVAESLCKNPGDWLRCCEAWAKRSMDEDAIRCLGLDEQLNKQNLENRFYRYHICSFILKNMELAAREISAAVEICRNSLDFIKCAEKFRDANRPDEVRRCLLMAEEKCQSTKDFKQVIEAWQTYLQDGESVARCKKKAKALPKPTKKEDAVFDLKLAEVTSNLLSYIHARVAQCAKGDMDLGNPEDPIKMIVLGFDFNQGGWVNLAFDSRPGAESDGEWTSRMDKYVEIPEWQPVIREFFDNDGSTAKVLMSFEGKEKVMKFAGDTTIRHLGKILKSFFFEKIQGGILSGLNLAPDCEVSVEDFEGVYGESSKLSKIMKASKM